MKLLQLKYFQTICKYNNITRAAGELHVSQPSLSNTIRELEEEFGVSLFYRRSKGLVLTEDGEFFLEEATKILEQVDALTAGMNERGRSNPIIRLGVPPMLASLIFPRLLRSFRESFPDTRLQMIENGTVTNKTMVSDGTLDAAIISSAAPLSSSFGYCDICSLDIYFYTSIENPLAAKTSARLEELNQTPLVLLAEDSFLTSFINQRFRELGRTPNTIINTNQLAAIRQLIDNNTASTFLFGDILNTDENIVRLSVEDLPTIQVKLIWNESRRLSRSTQSLIHHVKTRYSDAE